MKGVAICLWAENVSKTAEFYQKLLGLTDPPIWPEIWLNLSKIADFIRTAGCPQVWRWLF
jgi:hypothetical protein